MGAFLHRYDCEIGHGLTRMNADKNLCKSVFIRVPFIPVKMGRGIRRVRMDSRSLTVSARAISLTI